MTSLRTLSSLSAGQSATIQALHVDAGFEYRLNALGFRIGKQIQVIRIGPFNGPLHLRLGNTEVMLRQYDANMVEVVM